MMTHPLLLSSCFACLAKKFLHCEHKDLEDRREELDDKLGKSPSTSQSAVMELSSPILGTLILDNTCTFNTLVCSKRYVIVWDAISGSSGMDIDRARAHLKHLGKVHGSGGPG